MSLIEVRKAIAEVIKIGLPEFNVYNNVPSVTQAPAIVVFPSDDPTGSPHETMCLGSMKWYIDLFVLFPYTEIDSNQSRLDSVISPDTEDSLLRLLNDNPTLDGEVDVMTFTGIRDYGGKWVAGGADHVGAIVTVEVWTS